MMDINLAAGIDLDNDTGFRQVKNLEWDGSMLRKRMGRRQVEGTTRAYRGLHGFMSGSGWRRIAVYDGQLVVVRDYSDTTRRMVTAKSALNPNAYWSFVTVGSVVYGANGVDSLYMIDEYGAQAIDIRGLAYLTSHYNYLVALDNEYDIYWSALGLPSSWPTANYNRREGGKNKGVCAMREYVLILKANSLHIMQFAPASDTLNPWIFKQVSDVGCIAPRSVVSTGETVYFLGPQSPMKFDGVRVAPIMEHVGIQEHLRSQRENACSEWFMDRYYYLFIGDTAYVYDSYTETTRTQNVNDTACAFVEDEYQGKLYTVERSGTWLEHGFGHSDNGSAIQAVLELPPIITGGVQLAPSGFRIAAMRNGSSFTIASRKDYSFTEGSTTISLDTESNENEWGAGAWGTMRWSGDEEFYLFEQNLDATTIGGRANHIKITESSASQMAIKSVALDFRASAARGR